MPVWSKVSEAPGARTVLDEEFYRLWRTLPIDISLAMLSRFTLAELQVLSNIQEFSKDAHAELRTRLEILFKAWALELQATLTFMEETGTIMSGSAVLFVCNPAAWWPGDFDFYCKLGKTEEVVRFFEGQGYRLVPKADAPETGHGSAVSPEEEYCVDLMKEVLTMRVGDDGPKINIIESALPCAEAPIFLFHSTPVMNVITGKGIVCFYPQWTLRNKGVVNHPSGQRNWLSRIERELSVLEKYKDRGYSINHSCKAVHDRGQTECSICSGGWSFWDEGTLSMPFNHGDVVTHGGRSFSWRLGSDALEAFEDNGVCGLLERGAMVLVQGEGDGKIHLYHGLSKTTHLIEFDDIPLYL